MIKLLSYSALVLFTGMAAMAATPDYPPPFMEKNGAKTVKTQLHAGTALIRFAGATLNLKMFNSGEVNLFAPDNELRWGAIVIEKDKKPISGQRVKKSDNTYAFTYPDAPGLEERLSLEKDGRIKVELTDAQHLQGREMTVSMIREFFGNTTVEIDGKSFPLRAYREDDQTSDLLWNAPAQRIVFFADIPDKTFSLDLAKPTRIRLINGSGRYGLRLSIFPNAEDKELALWITSGTGATAAAAPKGYATTVDRYDFWAQDRLRLPDRKSKNLLQNSSFEQGFAALWFSQCLSGGFFNRAMWEAKPIRIDEQDARTGRASLRIMSDAPDACLAQRVATHAILLEPGIYTFSIYAKTDHPGQQKLRLTAPRLPPGANIWKQDNWKEKEFPLTADWQRYQLTFTVDQTAPCYFLLGASSQTRANCHLDSMQLERGPAATEYAPAPAEGRLITSAADNFIEYGKKIAARLAITTAKPNEAGSVNVTVRDFFGQIIRQQDLPFTTGPDGRGEVALALDDLPRGIFTIENKYRLADRSEHYEFTRLAVMNFLDNTHRHKNLFANEYIDPYGVCQFYPELLERYRKVGIGARAGFSNTEKLVADAAAKAGVESFSSTILRSDRTLTAKRPATPPSYGFAVLNNIVWYECPSVNRTRENYATVILPDYSPDDLRRIETGAARRTAAAPWVKIWGAFNEPEGLMPEYAHSYYAGEKNFRQYVELELAAARGAKRGNPAAMIGNSAVSCLRTDRIDTLDKLLTEIGDRFRYDCFLIHTYREAPEYPDLDADFQKLFRMLARHNYAQTPIYCPEGMHWKPYKMDGLINLDWVDVPWGPLSYDMGHQERLSAAWRARQWLLGLKLQDRVKLMNSSTNFSGFEMDLNLTPFATQKISNTLGRLLGNAAFVKDVRLGDETRCYVFEDEQKRPVAALWQASPAVDQGLKAGPKLYCKNLPTVEMWDLMEVRHELKPAADGSCRIRVGAFPIFLRGRTGETATLIAALENAELTNEGEAAVATTFALQSPGQFSTTFRNVVKHDFSGDVTIAGHRFALNLKPGEVKTVQSPLPALLTGAQLTFESLTAALQQHKPAEGKFAFREDFSGVLAYRADIRIDGNPDDWAQIPALDISQRLLNAKTKSDPAATNFSAKLKMAWSPEAFYLAVEVTDDKLSVIPQPLLRNGWRNDSLQIFFDTLADARRRKSRQLDSDDWSYGIYLKNPTGDIYVYRHHVPDIQLTQGVTGAKAETVADDVQAAFRKTATGYIYELAFSRRSIAPFKLAAGEVIGMSLMVNNQNGNGPTPESQLVWGNTAVPPQNNPTVWPAVMLVEKK